MTKNKTVYNTNGEKFYKLGLKQHCGSGCYHKAFKYFKKAVDMGYAAAKYPLAVMYYRGRGINQNLEEAKRLFKEASEEGHEFAGIRYMKIKDLEDFPDGHKLFRAIKFGEDPYHPWRHVEQQQQKCPACERAKREYRYIENVREVENVKEQCTKLAKHLKELEI